MVILGALLLQGTLLFAAPITDLQPEAALPTAHPAKATDPASQENSKMGFKIHP